MRKLRPGDEHPENLLLKRLPEEEWRVLEQHLSPVPVAAGELVQRAGKPIERIAFPCRGAFSLRKPRADEDVEVALVGRNGLLGVDVILGEQNAGYDAVALFGDRAWQIESAAFVGLLQRWPSLQSFFTGYVHAHVEELGNNVAAAKRAVIVERLAGWLIGVAELIGSDDLPITHAQISHCLGVRRSGITSALHDLEARHLLMSKRGQVVLRDRATLMKIAGSASRCPMQRALSMGQSQAFSTDSPP